MSKSFNIYCDESCHLEKDQIPVMVLGAVWCPLSRCAEVSKRLRVLKSEHGLSRNFKLKWVKVSPAKLAFYEAAVDEFFMSEDLQFRGIVIPDKSKLDHPIFNQTHDEFYYKMWFVLLKQIFLPGCSYRIYIDIKDTRGAAKVEKLKKILRNANYAAPDRPPLAQDHPRAGRGGGLSKNCRRAWYGIAEPSGRGRGCLCR